MLSLMHNGSSGSSRVPRPQLSTTRRAPTIEDASMASDSLKRTSTQHDEPGQTQPSVLNIHTGINQTQ